MSGFCMLLIVGIATGNVPFRISAELEEGLDLRDEWEGVWQDERGVVGECKIRNGSLLLKNEGDRLWSVNLTFINFNSAIDEGGSRFRTKSWNTQNHYFGIYKHNGDYLSLCFRQDRYPRSFRACDGQHLLILRRVQVGDREQLFIPYPMKGSGTGK